MSSSYGQSARSIERKCVVTAKTSLEEPLSVLLIIVNGSLEMNLSEIQIKIQKRLFLEIAFQNVAGKMIC